MVLVPRDTPGIKVIRNISVVNHVAPEGHCEIEFKGVRVPVATLSAKRAADLRRSRRRASGRDGYHSLHVSIGAAELALELMVERGSGTHGIWKKLHEQGSLARIDCRSRRIEIDQARLFVLKAAWMIDNVGRRRRCMEIADDQGVVPNVHTAVCERADAGNSVRWG